MQKLQLLQLYTFRTEISSGSRRHICSKCFCWSFFPKKIGNFLTWLINKIYRCVNGNRSALFYSIRLFFLFEVHFLNWHTISHLKLKIQLFCAGLFSSWALAAKQCYSVSLCSLFSPNGSVSVWILIRRATVILTLHSGEKCIHTHTLIV